MSVFDKDAFMAETSDQANDTEYELVPSGEYQGIIEKLDMPEGRTNKQGEPVYPLDITWNVLDEGVQKQMGREKVTVRQSLFLDLTGEGKLDYSKGKNVALGKLRDALGFNEPGKKFGIGMLNGAGPALIKVGAKPDKEGTPRNTVAVGKKKA